jgi:hypothetical protein
VNSISENLLAGEKAADRRKTRQPAKKLPKGGNFDSRKCRGLAEKLPTSLLGYKH